MKSVALVLLLIALSLPAAPPAKHRVLFNRFKAPEIAFYIADASGTNERMVTPHKESEYSPSLSTDGHWVVFTSEHAGQSDIYRVHPDGSGLEQLTSDPAFDDQAVLSPNGATLAFVSTRSLDSPISGSWISLRRNTSILRKALQETFVRRGLPTADGSPSAPTARRTPGPSLVNGSCSNPRASISSTPMAPACIG